MVAAYTLVEPAHRGYIPGRPFGLHTNGAAIHEILRLLTGSTNLRINASGKVLPLNWDEVQRKNSRNARPGKICELIFGSDMTIADYEAFIVRSNAKNNKFFADLLRELTLCLGAKKQERFTESFLYLYRILEYISVAFPMLYAASEKDFRKSHEFLQSLLQAEKDGDLKVLERAIPVIGHDSGLHHITFDFSVAGYEADFVFNLRQQFEAIISSSKSLKLVVIEDEGEILLRVPFNAMSSLMAVLRNRMFHYRIKETNFDLGRLGGSESICRLIVSEGIYWFAILFSEMVKTLAKR
jgi:hypothetical protein